MAANRFQNTLAAIESVSARASKAEKLLAWTVMPAVILVAFGLTAFALDLEERILEREGIDAGHLMAKVTVLAVMGGLTLVGVLVTRGLMKGVLRARRTRWILDAAQEHDVRIEDIDASFQHWN